MRYRDSNGGNFQKRYLSIRQQTTFFSAEGGAGFNIASSFDRLSFSFWLTGQSLSGNDNYKISFNISQVEIINEILKNIVKERIKTYNNNEEYKKIETEYSVSIKGTVNGELKEFGTLFVGTRSVNGIERISITMKRNGVSTTVVLHDKFADSCVDETTDEFIKIDKFDGSLYRLQREVQNWLNTSWEREGFDAVVNTIKPKNNNGNNGGGSYNNGNGNNYNNYNAPKEDSLPFDDDDDL